MEEGWTLEVKKVSAKSVKSAIEGAVEDADAIEEIKAFDITIYDKDGNAIQPDGSVQVSFSGTGIKGDAAEVYHVDDSKKKAEKVCDATTNSKVEFEAEHFSIYAVVGSNTVYANTRDTAYEVAKGDQLTLKSDNYKKDQEWKSDESSIVEVVDSGTTGWMNPQPYAIVEAKSEGTTFVKYNKEKFYITVTKANGTLSFDLNGGTGTKPADITGENGESVTLPTGNEITRENYTFLGWSTEKDANLVTSNGKAVVYPAGGTFEVSGKTTLYAVWAQSAGKLLGKIAIAIRKDGTIPGEPSLQYASYTFLTSSRGNSTLMSVDNVLDYINPAQTMVGKSNVESVLQPTFYSYVNNKNANGTYWNNATQYVEWYVVKYQNSDYAYHIDGVVRNKQNVYLDYDGNGYTDGLVPNGVQLVEGGSTTVSQAGNYYNGNSDWRDLKKAGYTFIGWNTSADGKGTSYQPGASITVRENTTLYAQWKAKGYTVKYDSDGGSAVADKNLKFADEVDVSATPTKDGYIFKGWYYNESEVKDATYASLVNDDESVQEITLKAKWQQKDGRFGYYLSLASADWKGGMPDNLEVSGTSGQGLPKYAEKVHYTYGDKYNVISNVPEAEGHAFIGWLDKKRGNQSAAIRTAGDELTYIYKAGDENQAYTLDALWASIAAKGGTYPYNGSSRQITADVAINEGLNLNAEYVEQAKKFIKTGKMEYSTDNKNWSEENPGFTDAGTYTVYVRQDVTVGGTTTTLQSSAQIVITPATITVTANNASKKYAEADPSEFTYSQSAGVNGETAGFAGRLERIAGEEVGHYAINQGSLVLADNGSFKAGNYTLSYVAGDFEIVNSDKLELTLAPYNNVYDGESHGIAVTKAVAGTEDVKLQYSKDGKTWQDDPITYKNVTNGAKTVYVKASAKGYDDKIVSETVTITPKTLTVTADNKVKKYGTADPKLTYQNENGVKTEVPGFEGKLEREAGEEVGHYDINQGSLTLKNNEDFKASNYELVYVKGDFEITKNDSLQLVVDPYNGTYDGHAHGVTVTTASAGKEAVTLQYSTDGSNWADKVEYIDVTNGAKTVYVKASAKGYDDKTVTSSITITPATITVTANNASKKYAEADPSEFTYSQSAGVNGETAGFAGRLERIAGEEVGHYAINQGSLVLADNGSFKAGNYTLSYVAGDFEIVNSDKLELTLAPYNNVYDGESHGIAVTKAVAGTEDVKLQYSKDGETWQDDPITYKNVTNGAKTVYVKASAKGYDDKIVSETVTITPKTLTVTADNKVKKYGTADPKLTYQNENGVKTEVPGFEGKLEREAGEEVGHYDINQGSLTLKNNEDFKASNYELVYVKGDFEITKNDSLQLVVDPYNGTYDGHAHGVTVTTASAGKEAVTLQYSTDGSNWADKVEYIDVTNGAKTVYVKASAKGYDDKTVTSSITITPATITVTANNASKKYAEADPSEFTYSQSAGVNGETAGFAGRLERIAGEEVGHYAINQGSLVLADNGSFKAGNYTLSYVAGDFEIVNSDKLELTLAPYNNVYDGESHGIAVTKAVAGTEDVKLQYSKDGKTWQDDPITYKNVTNGAKTVYVKASAKGYDDKIVSETVTITPRTVQVTTPTQLKVYDTTPLTAEGRIEGIVEGETATFTTTGSQTEVGNSKNTYTLTWDGTAKETNYTVSESLGTLIVTPQSIVPDPDPENPSYKGVEVNTPADVPYNGQDQTWKPIVTDADGVALVNGQDYTVSYDKDDRTNVTGTITVTITGTGNYTGTVTRTYQITPKAVTITTKSDDKVYNGTPLTADGSVDGIVEGETYSFTVTGSQTWVGSSANTYEMVWATEDNHYTAKQSNYAVSENVGTLTITDGTPETPVDPSLVVNKTHDENQTYKAGDVITFTITVKNIYDEVKTITLAEQEGVTLDSEVFENVEPGKEITATATYTVTEADIVNGTFTNNVTARFSGVDKDYTGTDTVDEFEDPNPHMTITKTTKDVEENHIYKLGETIKYVITVTNDGNLTLTNVKVEDALTGNAGQNAWTIDTFAPGATQTFETSYTVTEADVLAGKVINNVTGKAKDPTNPDEPKTPVTPGEKEDPVETPNPGLTVVKTSDTEGQVTLGQKITYTITVTNNGNVTISGVKLVDPLTRDNWTLGKIKPGETVTREATYTVTEKDIIAGKVENHAKATGKDPSGNDVTDEGEKTVTTEESNPHITVTKETTSRPKNGETYALGEEITYKITAKNTGNLTLKDVVVSDELTGNTGDKAFKIDGEFKPGDEKTFETSYTVTEADLGKTVVNVATATGKTPDPDKPEPGVDPGKKEDPTDQKKPAMSIEKKVIDQKEKYEIGDTVKYEITVTNTGNTTQNNILVEDQMNAAGQAVITKVDGANGTIDGAKATLDTLAPGKVATITAEYTVVKADRGNTITNAAVAKGEGEIPKTPDVPVDVEDVYDIHVVHAFAPGNEGDVTLPADYTIENLKPGTTKDLIAEAVTGYVAYPGTQNATIIDGDITVTFLYYKDEIGTDPKNPDQPDGVPDEFQRVVRFAAVNGTVSIDHAVVTLYGEDGKPAKNGVGHLSAEQIAAATANTGYDQSSLSWSPATPMTSYDITNEMTFTATFTATPAVPNTPNTPAPPATPNPPATPSDNPGVLDRVVDTIKDVAADVQEVFSSDDGDVPLANQNLDEHKCCILHFLIMLLTAILYGFFTHNMKKRQKKNFELREELDTELVKRGLPTSKEQKNS